MPRPFKGTIDLDIRKSKPDWDAFLDAKAPKDAPNVLVILYDDTGQAAWSPYGGRINMPTMDRLAKNGLTYSQWHTTAVCSPTRSCFLTGRNHHHNGFGSISEMAVGFPGYCGHIPPENGTIARVLMRAGALSGRHGIEHGDDRQARIARYLQPLPDRLGGGVLDAVPNVQALRFLRRRHLRPARDPLAEGH